MSSLAMIGGIETYNAVNCPEAPTTCLAKSSAQYWVNFSMSDRRLWRLFGYYESSEVIKSMMTVNIPQPNLSFLNLNMSSLYSLAAPVVSVFFLLTGPSQHKPTKKSQDPPVSCAVEGPPCLRRSERR
ncbi:unnamed protein product [Cuscuta epithymum]|uniref:Uncharacterized protein n=1 Tax=Cuscuta epithymum TaxID=186058 RepID=A0AAV0F7R6_9ASTE|nr:unnamed protein product [Cuscuta epithymum]